MEDFSSPIEREILDQYLGDPNPRPWIMAFSGGKDSTLLLTLVWNALKKVPPAQRIRQIHIVCNNTLVENPKILEYVNRQLRLIEKAADSEGLPITVTHTVPSLNDTFWVNMIGKGYPAPNSKFRWCTERLKIKPTTKYILETISTYGEVIILLGTRKAESDVRSRSIEKHEVKGQRLSRHQLPGAYVFAPIKNVATNDLWWYLAENESPWGSDNHELVHIYRNASDANDCPLILDKSVPSCGGSRFGCWVCTVVQSDRSMQGLISKGETWMSPLLKIRDFLAKTINRQDPDYSAEMYRMPIRRNLHEGLGPYWPELRSRILEQLLTAQTEIQKTRPEVQLVTSEELVAIQTLWQRDFLFEYDVAETCREACGRSDSRVPGLATREQALLKEVCAGNTSDYRILCSLVRAQRNRILLMNARGLQRDIERTIEEHLYPTVTDVYNKRNNR